MLVNPADLVARAKATIKECSVTEASECAGTDTLLIDVREPYEFRRGHLEGATLLPRGLLEFEIHKLVEENRPDPNVSPAEQPIVLYCGTGGRSALAAEALNALGYRNVRSMAGGIVAWHAANLPLATPE